MLVQQQMGAKNVGSFVVFVILLCVWAALGLEDGGRAEEGLLCQLVDPVSMEVDEDMADLLWINCRLDLIHMKEAVKDLDICVPDVVSSDTNEIDANCESFRKRYIQKMINSLDPQLKQTLLDCLRKNNLLVPIFGEGDSKTWYTNYLESLFPSPDAHRRNLGRALLQSITKSRVPDAASAPAVGSADLVPSSSQVPDSHASRRLSFSPPADLDSEPPPGENSSASPKSGSKVHANKQKSSDNSAVLVVVVTVSVTLVVAVLFLLCYIMVGYGNRRNDESPLLSLSLSEYSGSSHNPQTSGNSIKGEKLGSHNSSHDLKASPWDDNFYLNSDVHITTLDETPSSGATGGASKSSSESFDTSNNINAQVSIPLKPPPGRMGITASGIPPLKPPPGRADPLPPEPHLSFKAPSSSAGPPSPPVPPLPLKPSVACPPPPGLPPPPAPPGIRPGPCPPPPPRGGVPPPRPPPMMTLGSKVPRPLPLGPKPSSNSASSEEVGSEGDADAPKAKLKPFFWDKVLASPDTSMVWHEIKSGSFQFNEEMIESLFGYAPADKNKNEQKKGSSSQDLSTQYIQLIDSKKAQNLSILLKALNVTIEEVCDAINEGNELPSELLQTLLKMAPTAEEELKLRLFNGEVSQLGPAERFLKELVNIPFAFKRLEALLFMGALEEEVTATKESFAILEVACKEVRNSRLFLKLLEAVLKTGNRMNDGTFRGGAQAFKLDTLLKLSDVKGIDGKTTLLHFVVQEIIRSEGIRAARVARESKSFSSIKSEDLLEDISQDSEEHYRSLGLQVVSGLGNGLENVKKAAVLDSDSLTGTVAKLGHALVKTRDFLNTDMENIGEESEFHQTLKSFVQHAEIDIVSLLEEEKRIMALVKSTGDYFHGNAGKDEGLRLFVIVRDFLIMLDKVCREVRLAPKKPTKPQKKEEPTAPSFPDIRQPPSPDIRQRLFPAVTDRRINNSSSDDDSP